jgi:hypothetical protein
MNIDGHKHGAVGESSAVRPEVRCGVCGVEEEVEVEAEDVIAEEAREVRKMHDPKMPTKDEVEMHRLTHLPYRSWCEECVKGRGVEMPHWSRRGGVEEGSPEFHLDFCFPGEEAGEGLLTVLVVRERRGKMTLASVVPTKSTG